MKTIYAILVSLVFVSSALAQTSLDFSFTDNSDNEVGFIVERSVNGNAFVQIMTLEANQTQFTDDDIPLKKTVRWRVYAFNDYGDSDFSNVVAQVTAIPDKPSDLKIRRNNPIARIIGKIFKHRRKT